MAVAQMVNNGVNMLVDQNALLYVDTKFINNKGAILNKGEIIIGGDWENNDVSTNVFHHLSTGSVAFTGRNVIFSGTALTTFPRLILKGDGTFLMRADIDAFLSLDLDNAELKTGDYRFTLASYDANTLYFNNGFVNTGAKGTFVRWLKGSDTYLYPMGSSKLGIRRFVGLSSKAAPESYVGVSFVDNDASNDGYNRSNKSAAVNDINDSYYHVITQLKGADLMLDLSFHTTATEKFNGLASWAIKNQWDRLVPVAFQDNAAITAGLPKSFFYKALTLGSDKSIPIAFANVTNASPLNFYNAFSPDGDGKNDTWEIKNIDAFPDNDLKIFDRSGNLVYRMNGYSSSKYWDGQNAPSGTYIYILRVKIDGKDEYFKGSITMVKN
jgi:gliding motility-associated-like protein